MVSIQFVCSTSCLLLVKYKTLFFLSRILFTALILSGINSGASATQRTNDEGNVQQPLSWKQDSDRGVYQATLRPIDSPVPIGELHNWIFHIETNDKETFIPQQLVIQGGMPGHGHGFPVEPEISEYLGTGNYLIEGMKFNMAGDWQIRFGITGPEGWDTITFLLSIHPDSSNNHSQPDQNKWSSSELAILKSLSLASLEDQKPDPSNRFVGKKDAIDLGRKLFFDTRLSKNNSISCASCHQPEKAFTDAKKLGFGTKELQRHTPSLTGVSHNEWFYWDGRRDSLWAQAITPIESIGEMDNNRTDVVNYFFAKDNYATTYRQLTGTSPDFQDQKRFPAGASPYGDKDGKNFWSRMRQTDQIQVNQAFSDIGKFIAAYVTTLQFQTSRFDLFANALLEQDFPAADDFLNSNEEAGLKLFLDSEKTQCLRCHNGALFTNHGFHNVGTGNFTAEKSDYGRYFAIQAVRYDAFNCVGQYSDAKPEECAGLRFMLSREIPALMEGAYKVPSLRNISNTAPYFHDGRYDSLQEVIKHYTEPQQQMSEIIPIKLSTLEIQQLVDFLNSLSSTTLIE